MSDAGATIAALELVAGRVGDAVRAATGDVAHLLQAKGMAEAPVGTPGNTTNMPGDLARSIDVEGPVGDGDGRWLARVGPTTVYGRQRELGGDIYPKVAAMLRFEKFGDVVYSRGVHQVGDHYMLRARESTSDGAILAVVEARLAAAIVGG